MTDRLPAHLEAASLIRRAQTAGGFAAVLRKGDPYRGAITVLLRKRGDLRGILERELGPDFTYCWSFKPFGPSANPDSVAEMAARKEQFDPDFWLLALDIADPERFIAETTRPG